MIPEFPVFKRIDLADAKEVQQFTEQFPPYSDYNFISLWAWNINDTVCLSKLNGNLVVRFIDYLTGKPLYSFLGINSVNETVQTLLALSEKEGIELVLRLLPEVSITNLDASRFNVTEDRDGFDYIYDVNSMLSMAGPKFHDKRRHRKYFEKTYPHQVVELDISQPTTKDQILELYHDWVRIKMELGSTKHFQNEFLSLLRYLNGLSCKEHAAVGIFHNDRLIAVSISENTHAGYNICHFQKVITENYRGLNVYLVHEVAKILADQGIRYINWEQDMGIPGLRESKESFQPCMFLKKYSVST